MSLPISLLHAISRCAALDDPKAVLVTIVNVKGSAPREVGTSMLVHGATFDGTIGGGRLEHSALGVAQNLLTADEREAFTETYPLGDRLGQCCGGTVTLLYEPITPAWLEWIHAAIAAATTGDSYQHKTHNDYIHKVVPMTAQLVLCGAGHVGRALVHVLANAPIQVLWVDEREHEFPQNTPPNVTVEVSDLADVLIKNAQAGSAIVVTTHRHDLDFKFVEAALERTDLAYVGMIGSASKRARFERQWRQRNRCESALERFVCPIGADGPRGKEPEVLAIGVACEVLKALL